MAKIKRIAIIAPPVTTVPPIGQGGLETILTYKIEALIKMGHELHLYGAGKTSIRQVKFHQIFEKSLSELEIDPVATEASRKIRLESSYIVQVILDLLKNQKDFDVVYNHTRATELAFAPLLEKFRVPIFNIFHLPILPVHAEILNKTPQLLAISISDDQRADYPQLENFVATVHNGIDPDKYPLIENKEDFLLWVGTIGYHKNPLDALKVAKNLNQKIILMGKIRDNDYFEKYIKPRINGKNVVYLGELDYRKKISYFQKAKVALFPTKIREACPVTPLELTMCGTPVVAYPAGGTKELIKNGVNGFLTNNVVEMTEKVREAYLLDRKKCHLYAKENFSSETMAKNYLEVYERYINETSN